MKAAQTRDVMMMRKARESHLGSNVLYTLYSTHCTLHTVLYTLIFTLHPVFCILYPAHCTLHTVLYTLYSVFCTLQTLHALHSTHGKLHSAYCTSHPEHCTQHTSVQCSMHTVLHSDKSKLWSHWPDCRLVRLVVGLNALVILATGEYWQVVHDVPAEAGQLMILEGTARYASLHLDPAKDLGLWLRLFCPSDKKSAFHAVCAYFRPIVVFSTSVMCSSKLRDG